MNRLAALFITVFAIFGVASSAGASTYGAFGNLSSGDCQYETAANLVLREDPHARISTAEVLRAYRLNGIDGPEGTPEGLDYLEQIGFAGWRVESATPVVTNEAIVAGANAGGIFAALSWGHAIAIIHANPKRVVIVDDGLVQSLSWPDFRHFYDSPHSTLYALTWLPAGDDAVTFDGMSITGDSPSSMPIQVEPEGTTTALETNVFVNDGYAFQGWSTNPEGPVEYADGAEYTFTKGATLYAIWTYVGAN